MRPRGVTLVELLAAISILVIVTALAMPAVRNRLGAARLDAAEGQIQAAVLTTRAEAMRLGSPVALGARPNASSEVDLLVTTLDRTESAIEMSAGTESTKRASGAAPRTPQVWATLASGLKITDQPDAAASADLTRNPPRSRSKTQDQSPAELRIAVFCPDGTAISSGPVYLSDGDTTLTIKLSQWVGGAAFTTYTADTQEPTNQADERPSGKDGPEPASGSTGSTGATGGTR
jgi:prepilin-type N-terminal cleavage/methylation domain-containing protein